MRVVVAPCPVWGAALHLGGIESGSTNQQQGAEGPTGPPTVAPDPAKTRHKPPPAVMKVGSDSDPTTHTASTHSTGKQAGQTTATPYGEHHRAATSPQGHLRHRSRWILSAAATVAATTGVVIVTTTGILKSPASTGSISPPLNTAAPAPVQTTVISPPNTGVSPPVQTTVNPPPQMPRGVKSAQKASTSPPRQASPPGVYSRKRRTPAPTRTYHRHPRAQPGDGTGCRHLVERPRLCYRRPRRHIRAHHTAQRRGPSISTEHRKPTGQRCGTPTSTDNGESRRR